jgi:DNA-binding NarL/FixJ family response regulator
MSMRGNGRWRGLPGHGTDAFEALAVGVRRAFPRLSRRQAEVAVGVWRSLADKEIADWLGCSRHTVREHESEILRRLCEHGVERRGDIILAVERALREGAIGGP